MIAETVSILNKFGYMTIASCESHYERKEYDVSYPKENMVTGIYILFKSKYKIPNIPEGFESEELDGKTELFHIIHYYDTSGNHRNIFDFWKEKEKYCKILEEWAKKLPERER